MDLNLLLLGGFGGVGGIGWATTGEKVKDVVVVCDGGGEVGTTFLGG